MRVRVCALYRHSMAYASQRSLLPCPALDVETSLSLLQASAISPPSLQTLDVVKASLAVFGGPAQESIDSDRLQGGASETIKCEPSQGGKGAYKSLVPVMATDPERVGRSFEVSIPLLSHVLCRKRTTSRAFRRGCPPSRGAETAGHVCLAQPDSDSDTQHGTQ